MKNGTSRSSPVGVISNFRKFRNRLNWSSVGDRVFTDMDQWIEIRRRVLSGEMSKWAACIEYGIHWDTLT